MFVAGKKRGFGLVEVVIAASIISLVIATLISTTTFFLTTSKKSIGVLKAGYLLEEGVEALKYLRDEGWNTHITTLTNGTPYYLFWNGSRWTATTSSLAIDSVFYRTFTLSPVYRDFNDDIASSGDLDVGSRKATITVSWYDQTSHATTSKSLVTYITNLFDN